MSGNEVIKRVLNGSPEAGWSVFPYSFKNGLIALILEFIYFLVIGGMFYFLGGADFILKPTSLRSNVPEFYVIVIGMIALVLLVALIFKIYDLFHVKKSMIVLTDKKVVKSYRGKINEYDYSQIKNLKMTYNHNGRQIFWLPGYKVSFQLKETNEYVTLAEHFTFGSALDIFNVLKNEV